MILNLHSHTSTSYLILIFGDWFEYRFYFIYYIPAITRLLHFSHLYGIIEMLGLNKKEYFDHDVSNENIIDPKISYLEPFTYPNG
jgi:hypothetical protein